MCLRCANHKLWMQLSFYYDSKAFERENGELTQWFVIESCKAKIFYIIMA